MTEILKPKDSKKPFCQCLHDIENNLPRTKRCFAPCEAQMLIKKQREEDSKKGPIFFYEHEFYPFSNFSAFRLQWKDYDWDTSEHAYHSEKFPNNPEVINMLKAARSAHEAFKIAQDCKNLRRPDWDDVRVDIMRKIITEKARQHPYVMKKLRDSGKRELIEDSWRDDFWGWGPNKDGQNMLGKLWMQVRSILVAQNL